MSCFDAQLAEPYLSIDKWADYTLDENLSDPVGVRRQELIDAVTDGAGITADRPTLIDLTAADFPAALLPTSTNLDTVEQWRYDYPSQFDGPRGPHRATLFRFKAKNFRRNRTVFICYGHDSIDQNTNPIPTVEKRIDHLGQFDAVRTLLALGMDCVIGWMPGDGVGSAPFPFDHDELHNYPDGSNLKWLELFIRHYHAARNEILAEGQADPFVIGVSGGGWTALMLCALGGFAGGVCASGFIPLQYRIDPCYGPSSASHGDYEQWAVAPFGYSTLAIIAAVNCPFVVTHERFDQVRNGACTFGGAIASAYKDDYIAKALSFGGGLQFYTAEWIDTHRLSENPLRWMVALLDASLGAHPERPIEIERLATSDSGDWTIWPPWPIEETQVLTRETLDPADPADRPPKYSGGRTLFSLDMAATAEWQFDALDDSATYRAYATWHEKSNRTDAAQYEVNGQAVTIDQRNAPSGPRLFDLPWEPLAEVQPNGGTITVDLANSGSGFLFADAVLLARLPDAPTNPHQAEIDKLNQVITLATEVRDALES